MIGIGGSFLSKHGGLKSQGEFLSDALEKNGIDILRLTESKNKFKRIVDVFLNIKSNKSKLNLIILQVFGTKSIFLECFILFLSKIFRIKVISHVHGGSIPEIYERKKFLFDYIFSHCKINITPSPYLYNFLKSKGFNAKIIYNFIDDKDYEYYEKETIKPTILWMRTFHKIYNPKMAILTIIELKNKIENVKLYMAGYDSGEKKNISLMVEEFNLNKEIEILGVLDNEGKQKYSKICDIYLNTTNVDNSPVSIIEMMAFGLNIISTDAGGIKDMIKNNINSIIIPKNDYEKMAESIFYLIRNQEIAKVLRENARLESEKYREKNIITIWKNLINDSIF